MKNYMPKIDVELKQYLMNVVPVSGRPVMWGDSEPGIKLRFTFPNGWGASVIKNWGSYGFENDEWEIAVLDKNGFLHYNNPICEGIDVVGYRTDEDVNDILHQILYWEPDVVWQEYEEETEGKEE